MIKKGYVLRKILCDFCVKENRYIYEEIKEKYVILKKNSQISNIICKYCF